MSPSALERGNLLQLAAEGIAADVKGCAAPGGLARLARPLVQNWLGWVCYRPAEECRRAFRHLAQLPSGEARLEAAKVLDRLAPDAGHEDRSAALDYLAGLPGAVQRVLIADPGSGDLTFPPDLSLQSAEDLLRLLPPTTPPPWASSPADLQKEPDPPSVIPVLDVPNPPRRGPDRTDGIRHLAVYTKLQVLLRCHELVARDRRRRFWMRLLALGIAIVVGGGLALAAGSAVYFAVFDPAHIHAQSYRTQVGTTEYYIDGHQVSQQQYDYFLRTHSNEVGAASAAVAVGLAVFLAVLLLLVLVLGRRDGGLYISREEQIDALCKEHPDAVQAWGGPGVLRERELVAEVLRIVEAERR
jgi:hypothetical protein